MKKVRIVLPTYNAGEEFPQVLECLLAQNIEKKNIKIYDSESTDNTVGIAEKKGICVKTIVKKEFSHSATRTQIAQEAQALGYEHIIFLTQDVYLQPGAVTELYDFFIKEHVSLAYGKQEVDLAKGNIFEFYARHFNYPPESSIKTKQDQPKLGIKTIFNSDAFALYHLKDLEKVGYFGYTATFSEDMLAAAKLIEQGKRVGYCATARVLHTHNYRIRDEYQRYKKIGQFHRENPQLMQDFGQATQEGVQLAFSELAYLIRNGYILKVPESIIRNAAKYFGMRSGKREKNAQ